MVEQKITVTLKWKGIKILRPERIFTGSSWFINMSYYNEGKEEWDYNPFKSVYTSNRNPFSRDLFRKLRLSRVFAFSWKHVFFTQWLYYYSSKGYEFEVLKDKPIDLHLDLNMDQKERFTVISRGGVDDATAKALDKIYESIEFEKVTY